MPILTIDKFTGGLRASTLTSPVQMDITECEDATNVEFYPRGTVSQRSGYGPALITREGSGVTKLYKWKDESNANFQLGFTCASGDTLSATIIKISTNPYAATYLLSAGAGGWNPNYDDAISCTSYMGSAVATYRDSIGAPIVYTGSDAACAQTTIMSGCTTIQGWGSYLFVGNHLVGGVRKGSRLSWNTATNIVDWPASYYVDLDPDDTDEITATTLLGDYLVVFKKKKIFIVYWVGGTLLFKEARRVSSIGCAGPNSLVTFEGKVIFLSSEGVYSFDGTGVKELSTKIRPLFKNMNPTYMHMSEVHRDPDKKQIWFCVATGSSTTKNTVYVYDYELDNWTVFSLTCSAISYLADETTKTYGDLDVTYSQETQSFDSYNVVGGDSVIIGFLSGTIHQFGTSPSDNGTAIASSWKSVWLDAENPIINKRLVRMTLIIGRKSTGSLLLDLQEDWKNDDVVDSIQGWSGTQTISMTGVSTADLLEKRVDKTRQARAFQVVLSGDSSGNPWSVHKIMMDIIPKGRTLV